MQETCIKVKKTMLSVVFPALYCISVSASDLPAIPWHLPVSPIAWKDETNVPTPSRYESFENGIPEHWTLEGEGSFSINPWHYKLGKQSLQWDFKAGDVIRINNTLGNTKWRGGVNNSSFSHFGVWVYNKKPMPDKYLRFEFREGEAPGAYFDFYLNFKGWQYAFPIYGTRSFSDHVPDKTDNILIKAPSDTTGRVMIDALVYNGPMSYLIHHLPNRTPWKPPVLDETENPLPETVSTRDIEAMERVKDALVMPMITEKGTEAGHAGYELAMDRIKRLNIVEDEHGIRGRPINLPRWHAAGQLAEFFTENRIPESELEWFNRAIIYGGALSRTATAISSGITQEQYETLCEHSVLLWKYLLDQGFNTSAGNGFYYTGTYSLCISAAFLTREALFKHGLMGEVSEYLQYNRMPFFASEAPGINMDYFAAVKTFLYGVFLVSNDRREQVRLLRFLSNRFNREITGDFSSGFKPDGTGWHASRFLNDYKVGGLNGIAEIAYLLSDSSFALNADAFDKLKLAVLRMFFYSNGLDVPLHMYGTGVFESHVMLYRLPDVLKHLALAGDGGCDEELAQAYVNLKDAIPRVRQMLPEYMRRRLTYDPVFETEYGIQPSSLPEGNISMPYAPLVAQRRADWLAVAWGGDADMRDRGNNYGYMMENAPLDIIDREGLAASGMVKDGWDWNRQDGATGPYIPNLTEIKFMASGREIPPEKAEGYEKAAQWLEKFKTSAEPAPHWYGLGNGGISWRGINGCFRKVFANDKLFNGYRGIKSYFFIDDRIYALGSDITSYSKEYSMQTTLYQKALPDPDSPTWINGKKITGFSSTNQLPLTINHYLIDSVGNGYFIPAGQNLYTARETQNSRVSKQNKHEDTVGDFATVWLDHGVECENAKYVYVVMPYCNPDELAEFNENSYKILQQDGKAHILHDKIDGFYAGIFFQGGTAANLPHVSEVERACQIMYREKNDALEIAFGDPATYYERTGKAGSPLKVTFAGAWELKHPVDGVRIISSDADFTVIEFDCIHGKTFDFVIQKEKTL